MVWVTIGPSYSMPLSLPPSHNAAVAIDLLHLTILLMHNPEARSKNMSCEWFRPCPALVSDSELCCIR
jgi:hypothetical protein